MLLVQLRTEYEELHWICHFLYCLKFFDNDKKVYLREHEAARILGYSWDIMPFVYYDYSVFDDYFAGGFYFFVE